MLQKRWFGYLAAYLMWVVDLALALWFLLNARNTFPPLIASLLIENAAHAANLAVVIDRFMVLVGGIAWLVLMTFLEQYFRKGVTQGRLWARIARVTGILLVLLFIVEGSQLILLGLRLASWSVLLILVFELALGAGLIYLSKKPVASSMSHGK